MPATAAWLDVNPYDARQNVHGGARYLKQLILHYGDQTLALIAYNWGPGNTDKWLKRGGKCNQLPKQALEYAGKVPCNIALSKRETQLAWEGK